MPFHDGGEYRFEFLVAACRFVVRAIQAFGAYTQGHFDRGVEIAVPPAFLGRVFLAGIRGVDNQGIDAAHRLVD